MLINLRNALMTGKRLPYDAEVEYLESSGTQYIETNIIDDPANNLAHITFSIPTSTSSSMFLFGSSAQRFNYVMARWGSNRYNFGPNASTTPVLPIFVGDPHVGTYTLSNGEMTYTLDGVSGVYSTSTVHNNLPLAIFRIHNTASLPFVGRVHGFKVVRKSDSMVIADLIPVRVGTVGYLYDRVTRKLFGNAGAGDFALGQDVVPITWADNERYLNNGVVEAYTGLSRIDDYIPVVGGHSITWKWGDRVIGQAYMIVYNANKQVIDFWSPNQASGERTLNINATAAYVRYSVDSAFKETTFFKDNTTGEYAVMNGMVVV